MTKNFILPATLGILAILATICWYVRDVRSRKTWDWENDFPQALGRYEGCPVCHRMKGFSGAHSSDIGCVSCHLGNPFSLSKNVAHRGILLVPGNLAESKQTCGRAGCHPHITDRIVASLMTTAQGMVTVTRFVFDETTTPNGKAHIASLANSPADGLLSQLCASCHLGRQKRKPGPVDESARGGGCVACHIDYCARAKEQLDKYQKTGELPSVHPKLSIRVTDEHCFGCHSRSGRISTNYQGWHETDLVGSELDGEIVRKVEKYRTFIYRQADVHHEKGLACIDCHTWRETMGDGQRYNHEEQQLEISCRDCHFVKQVKIAAKEMDETSRKILALRGFDRKKRNFARIAKTGHALVNVFFDEKGKAVLQGKISGKKHDLYPPANACREIRGHKRLSCKSCHSSWASHCLGCHTKYREGTDKWLEYRGSFTSGLPTLGVRVEKSPAHTSRELIDTFIPGMVLTVDTGQKRIFRRLYAPVSPHTTASKGRSCRSCHNDPLALGLGRGKLVYKKDKNSLGRWKFFPEYSRNHADSLPSDAWTGFLKNQTGASTRMGCRPLNAKEQRKILTVGACLTCHRPDRNNAQIYFDFAKAISATSEKCVVPVWD